MNFKEEYKKDNARIKPDADFMKQLRERVKAEEKKQGWHLKKSWISAAVITVILLAGLMGYQLLLPSDKPVPEESISSVAGVASGGVIQNFSPEEDRKKYERLVIYLEKDCDYLEVSRTEDFARSEKISVAEAREMLKDINQMVYQTEATEPSGTIVFYKAHGEDGESLLFTMEDERIVRLSGCTGQLCRDK